MERLEQIGFSDWFQANIDPDKLAGHQLARVTSVHKYSYMITNGTHEVLAELAGKVTYSAISVADLPTAGDWVYVDFNDNNTHATIHNVFSRKTLIQRKKAGKTTTVQLIAANVDMAFIVQSVVHDFNLNRLERYLEMLNESNITPAILLSKSDLISQAELNDMIESVIAIAPNSTVIPYSSKTGENINLIKSSLLNGHTYCLLGSSGVGKTTLLNTLIGEELYKTQPVRKGDSKGRHTTTRRELIHLGDGVMLIDTPGMRELGNLPVDSEPDETFPEIIELSIHCKFRNCTHTSEKGCAILSAIEDGTVAQRRYDSFMKTSTESAFNELSTYEKRQKDKRFGKLIKTTLTKKKYR